MKKAFPFGLLGLLPLLLQVMAAPRALAGGDPAYLGINNETGFNTDPTFVQNSITQDLLLGFGSVRMGMDGVNGHTVGVDFSFDARDAVVDAYNAAGIDIHASINPRHHVHAGSSYDEWKANWAYFVRGVMNRYQGKVSYYIIGNEPDLEGYPLHATPQQEVDFTQIAYEIAKCIDPNILIESPPVSSPDSTYTRTLLQLGVADYADYIGLHVYSTQIDDGRFNKPWDWMRELGIRKPIAVSESGVSTNWAPAGFPGGPQEWRRRFLPLYYLALKRYGISHSLLFSLTFNDAAWGYLDRSFNPYEPGYDELLYGFQPQAISNGDFESANDPEREWVIYYQPDRINPPAFITFVRDDPDGARSGSGYARMDAGADTPGDRIILRRIGAQLTPGLSYRIEGWASVSGGARATLKALGFDALAGADEAAASTSVAGSWQYLSVTVPVSSDHAVVELSTVGTGNAGDAVKWDDVSITEAGADPPPESPETGWRLRGRSAAPRPWGSSRPGQGCHRR